jgi:hypothetical protein
MRWNSLILIGLVGVVCACTDDRDPFAPSSRSSTTAAPNMTVRAILDCVGTLPSGAHPLAVSCAPATVDGPAAAADPAARAFIAQSVTLGRQNIDVTLAFANYALSGGVFSANVTVQNLLNQTMGDTINGNSSLTGTRVFFMSNPAVAVTSGTGTATVEAPDTGTFTASFQPYFDYGAAIAPNATSPAQSWKFKLGAGVEGFTFSVEISTILPAEKSIRRWVTLSQGLTGNDLSGIWRHSASDAYAVGLSGALLEYNGSTWASVGTGLPATNYRAVSGVAGQAVASVWAVGDNGAVVHDTAGTWSSVSTGQSNSLYGVWVAAAGNVYAVGANGTVVHLNASHWTTMSTPNNTPTLRAVWGNDATHIWAVGDNGGVYFGNGSTWVKQTSGTTQGLTGVWGDAATDVYAVGTSGTIIHLNTSGNWSSMTSGSNNDLAAIGGSAATDIWAVGDDGTTLHYNGTKWSTVGPNSGIPLTGVTAGSSSAIWAVGVQGSLLSSSGSAWQVSMQSGLSFYDVWASSATDVYVSSLGTMLHYNGTQWTNAYVSDADSMDGVWGGGPQPATVYSVGENGTLATLSGGTWTTQSIGTHVYALWGPNTTSFYTGAGGGLIGYLDNGILSSYDVGTSANVQSIWGSSANNVYAVASDGTIYNEKNTDGNWNQMTAPGGGGTLYAVYGSSGTDIYAVGASGRVLHNTGTTSWTAQTSGTTVTLRGVWADTPGSGYTADAYAVGDNGVVQHYNGSKWINMPAPVSSRFRSVYGTSATNLYVVGDNGVVLLGTQ